MTRLFWTACLLSLLGQTKNQLNAQSASRQAGYRYLSPVPKASYVSAQTRFVLVRFDQISPGEVKNLTGNFISVVGDQSGPHPGSTHVAGDGRTVIFTLQDDFQPNESVTATLNPQLEADASGKVLPFQYSFMVTAPMPGSLPRVLTPARNVAPIPEVTKTEKNLPSRNSGSQKARTRKDATTLRNGVSVPSDFPQIILSVNNQPSPGYLFLENGEGPVPPYTMIVDNQGLPVWYRRGRLFDFKIQPNGTITGCLTNSAGFLAFDQNLDYLRTYRATNGYVTDGHDLKVQPDGSYFLIATRTNSIDLSLYMAGGNPKAAMTETIVQGFTASDELIFQWRAWDNYNIVDQLPNTDFPHLNALDFDDDGNLLVSARHLSEVTKIDRDSGDVLWRLSGAHSSYTFVNDSFNGTSWQHHITALGHNHYLLFDNGDYHTPQVSRAVEYYLERTNMTATMVWQFRDTPDKYAYWQGSAQRLPSGNTLIDFVRPEYPKVTEVDPNGVKRFELSMSPEADSYRAFRFPWNGVVTAPYLALEQGIDHIVLLFNKFGDTNVAFYRIYGGPEPEPTTLLDETSQTLDRLSNLPNGSYYFRVTAVSKAGVESRFSNEEQTLINFVAAGQNLVSNGDFSEGANNWQLNLTSAVTPQWTIENGTSDIYAPISSPELSSVQLEQAGLVLLKDKQYILEFDAWASSPRYIQAQLASTLDEFTDYSELPVSFLTPNHQHYRYVFTMQQTSDATVILLFNLGASAGHVYLSNISLFTPAAGDLNLDSRVDFLDLYPILQNWLRQKPGLPEDLNLDGRVNFIDFSILGRNWSGGDY